MINPDNIRESPTMGDHKGSSIPYNQQSFFPRSEEWRIVTIIFISKNDNDNMVLMIIGMQF